MLPGEDPASPYLEDAQHWAGVYGELVAFKEAVVNQFQVKQGQLSPEAEAELHRDETGLRAELQRLRLHLRYWEERQRDAVPKSGPHERPAGA